MRFRAAKLLPVMIAATFAAPALSVITPVPAQAETCLTAPTGATPAGKHWRYRVERGSKRQCWYLGDKRGGSTAPVAQNSASDGEHKPAPSLADARAELIAEPSDPAPDAVWPAPEQSEHSPSEPSAAPAASDAPPSGNWSLASRWSDASTTAQDHPVTAPAETAMPPSSLSAADQVPSDANAPYDQRWLLMAGLVTAFGLAAAIIKLAMRFGRSWPKVRAETRPDSPFDAINIADLSAMPWTEPRTEARAKPQAAPAVKPAPQPRPSALNPEAPRQQPNWLRVAQERAQSERASQAAEQLLAQLAARRIA
ncbi:hypothetical protein NP284_30065 [Rhodopseudomonas pseudopalustris]|uniref:hypothetical protein n=1 Tax=Rhodopseudomonas pseudopalustris TaxID=1513892 RepID=UPI003F94E50E